MNVAGPSRPRGSARESTYERDLRALFADLTVDEMDEIQTIFAHRTGTGASDYDIAMSDLMQQARALAIAQQDRALALRIAEGEDVVDGDTHPHPLVNAGGDTQGQGRDRPLQGTPGARNDTNPSQRSGGWFSSMMSWMFDSKAPGSASTPPAAAPTPQPVAPQSNRLTGHDCVICQDPIRGAEVRTPCGHYYDIGCITDLFQSATRDETLFPPRCCRQEIPIPLVRPHLIQTLLVTLDEKRAEFSTLKRVYCSSPTCSRFLGPLSEKPFFFNTPVYTCTAPVCGRRTCAKCRAQYMDWAHVCNSDEDANAVLALGQRAGWARCPGCAQLIELHLGCFHMTCRCRTEFCYLCRARWKTCTCPQWDERRLMAVAEERVDAQLERQQGRRLAPAAVFVPAPAPVPARAPAPVPVARPVPLPVPAQRPPAPTPAAPPVPVWRPLAPTLAAPPVPVRLPGIAEAATIAARHTSVLASAGASASASTPSWRARAPTSNVSADSGNSKLTPASTSASGSASTSSWRPRAPTSNTSVSASTPSWQQNAKRDTNANTDVMRQRLVREMMDRLRVDHECSHGHWHYRKGGGICQSCGHHLPLYLFRCQGCEMLACNRCRRNRL